MKLKGKIDSASYTDKGLVRPHNEDMLTIRTELGLMVLADGMGGYKAGEIASTMAVNSITEFVAKRINRRRRQNDLPTNGESFELTLLRDAITEANRLIHETAGSESHYNGMGTTIIACLLHDNRISVAHVGDSRLYRIRNERMEQITVDHSLLQELVSKGFYTPEEARKSLNKNLVTRALGVDPDVMIDTCEDAVQVGDLYLLCSDGLTDMVEDEDILLALNTFSGNLRIAAEQLVQLANDNGGRDNISVIVTKIIKPFGTGHGLLDRLPWQT